MSSDPADSEDRDEGPLDVDLDDLGDDESHLASCPACGAEVYEDAIRCCSCGQYITPTTGKNRTWPWLATGVVVLIVLALSLRSC